MYMRYSYEYTRKCVELYMGRNWPETPEEIKDSDHFHRNTREWVCVEEANGPEVFEAQRTEEGMEAAGKVPSRRT